jgi:hypothetical protein
MLTWEVRNDVLETSEFSTLRPSETIVLVPIRVR